MRTKRNAKECELVPGDKVYMKNIIKDKKLSTTFAPTYLINSRKGKQRGHTSTK